MGGPAQRGLAPGPRGAGSQHGTGTAKSRTRLEFRKHLPWAGAGEEA